MGDAVFNISKGKVAELAQRVLDNDPATAVIRVFLWEGAGIDSVLIDLDFVASIEGDGGFSEADFTNYAPKVITDSGEGLTVAFDDGADLMKADFNDVTWTSAGNATNNSLTRLTTHFDGPGTDVDATMVNLTFYDFVVATDGSDLTAQVNALGFFQATE